MENNPDNVSVDAGNTKEESSDQIERNERLCMISQRYHASDKSDENLRRLLRGVA